MEKILTLFFLVILLLIFVAPKFVEDSNIAVIFVILCVVTAVFGIFKGIKNNPDKNNNSDSSKDNKTEEK